MKLKPDEVAYQLLHHFADVVPYTSYNLAEITLSIRVLLEKLKKYNRFTKEEAIFLKEPPNHSNSLEHQEQVKLQSQINIPIRNEVANNPRHCERSEATQVKNSS